LIQRKTYHLLTVAIIFLLTFKSQHLFGQNTIPDSVTRDTSYIYTSLEEALKFPDKVVKLELKHKKYNSFPKEIFKFPNLQYLDLSRNRLKELPEAIEQLKDLQYLNVSKNSLEVVPSQIGELKNLVYLNLNQNELVSLPSSIGNLVNLKTLDLWSNNLEDFPDEMQNLKSLLVLDLRVILIPDAEQTRIQSMLPGAKVYFSPYCKCQQ
jgi:Leucine-rich repeat (LRR) protein